MPPERMTSMRARRIGAPLERFEQEIPVPGPHELLIEVAACGVCRTDLHVIDGEVEAALPIVPGHEIVGRVIGKGRATALFSEGDCVGVPWLGGACGECSYCRSGRENLCDRPVFTGASRDGGYATHVLADERFCLPIPERYSDAEAAPLLCAGLIGYRSLKMAGNGERLGIYGFGAAAHIVAQVAQARGQQVFAFVRPDDVEAQRFAETLGCWAGPSDAPPPCELDAAIIFAPVGALVPAALRAVRKGGRVVCGGIHMSDIPGFPYHDLWGERVLMSVANLTRRDGLEFMALAGEIPLRVETTLFPLAAANEAIERLRTGRLSGAAVLMPGVGG